ncbi:MAG: hypothetical protein JWO03_1752 [Bacteroidetes bacterium]|nr:hypothetical protein [Bacteroidota bacterium]
MRTIYPKLITTLFLLLLVAVIVRFSDSHGHVGPVTKTAQLDKK